MPPNPFLLNYIYRTYIINNIFIVQYYACIVQYNMNFSCTRTFLRYSVHTFAKKSHVQINSSARCKKIAEENQQKLATLFLTFSKVQNEKFWEI